MKIKDFTEEEFVALQVWLGLKPGARRLHNLGHNLLLLTAMAEAATRAEASADNRWYETERRKDKAANFKEWILDR